MSTNILHNCVQNITNLTILEDEELGTLWTNLNEHFLYYSSTILSPLRYLHLRLTWQESTTSDKNVPWTPRIIIFLRTWMVRFYRSCVTHSNFKIDIQSSMHTQIIVLIELMKSVANFICNFHTSLMLVGSSRKNNVPNLVTYDKVPALQKKSSFNCQSQKVNKEFRKHSFVIYL
jgi:hypothetical protein